MNKCNSVTHQLIVISGTAPSKKTDTGTVAVSASGVAQLQQVIAPRAQAKYTKSRGHR